MRTGKLGIACFALVAAFLAPAAASAEEEETIILTDGRSYTGRVVERGENVRIEMSFGTIDIPSSEVAYIIPAQSDANADADAEPVEPPDEADEDSEQTDLPDTVDAGTGFSLADATRPEPVVFMLMRTLSDARIGTESYQARQKLRRFQILAHDRRRKVAGQWRPPDYFIRTRAAHMEHIEAAEELQRKADRIRGDDAAERHRKRQLQQRAAGRYRTAAQQWPDPLLRQFLMGAAELYAENYARAEGFFRSLVEEAPYVAGFHQGHSIALRGLRRHNDALSAGMNALRLHPESPQALALVVDAMERVAGAETDRPPYTDARELLRQYSDTDAAVRRARRDQRWLMPGLRRQWGISDARVLPEMPYDRLCFRQAVAVPVHEHFLVVDVDVVEEADEVFVRLADGTWLPAEVEQVRTFGRRESPPPLRLIGVADASFTPLEIAEAPPDEADLTVKAAPFYAQMGSRIRQFSTRLESDGDDWKPTQPLAAGESASPVLAAEGAIAGILAAKTDPTEDNAGPDLAISPAEIRRLVEDSRLRIGRGGLSFGTDRVERTAEPREADGKAFLVIAIFGEKFE